MPIASGFFDGSRAGSSGSWGLRLISEIVRLGDRPERDPMLREASARAELAWFVNYKGENNGRHRIYHAQLA